MQKKAKLDAEGVGSKTAFYYVPNAFTREFIGLLEMNKWAHMTVFFDHYAIHRLTVASICVTKKSTVFHIIMARQFFT
ncbi:hypothetical protein OL548_01100 [Lysinibacillus sp. MHQ-1]|nr:hypothetical protein OL548_01100 [Lysinibacillus sp. MHQ-1]